VKAAYKKAGVSSVGAEITRQDGGGFVAVASNGDLDRDGEVIQPGCFAPLPPTVPVHLDHSLSARDAIGRGRPHYVGERLMIDVTLASTPDSQTVRQKIADGIIDSMSIVFRGEKWETLAGVRTCVKGTLYAADIVSVPSNPGARILSVRALSAASRSLANEIAADALLTLARIEIAEAKAVLYGPNRRRVNQELQEALAWNDSARSAINRFKRSL